MYHAMHRRDFVKCAAAAVMVKRADRIEPDPALRGVYDEGYALYIATYEALAPLYARRARHGGK